MRLVVTGLRDCPAKSYVPVRDKHKGGVSASMWDDENDLAFVFRFYRHVAGQYELADVWIRPQYRSKMYSKKLKYSAKLMRTAMGIIHDIKCNAYLKTVWLWTLDDNMRAIALYRKYGFLPRKMHKNREKAIRKQHKWIKKNQNIIQMVLHV
jgi:ribosomal protein S18 acetylase RimI-like enzyme